MASVDFGRPIQISNTADIVGMIENGRLDLALDDLESVIRNRRNTKREDTLRRVRQEFGPEAALALVQNFGERQHTGQPTEWGCDDDTCCTQSIRRA